THITENCPLLLIVSAHDCFLSAIPVESLVPSAIPHRLFPQPVQSCRSDLKKDRFEPLREDIASAPHA
ncbi:MAG: hypothetical protein WAN70_06075, partial [Terriglobales bacterium]